MTQQEAIEALDALDASDPEVAHAAADHILLTMVPIKVADAYIRLTERAPFWATS